MRRTTDPLTYFRALKEKPFDFDFYQALRRIECLYPDKPRLGQAMRPVDEPVRLGQEPALTFAPATLSAFEPPSQAGPARMQVRFFGLFGPNGPLPLHLTEYAWDRKRHVGDESFPRFVDMFHHRFLALFFRAWAQAQPCANLDRPREDRFAYYIGSLFGLGSSAVRDRDDVSDSAKLFFVGHLARQVRNPDGLEHLLSGYFRVPTRIEEFVGHWMTLPEREMTRLGGTGAMLGQDSVMGSQVWDRQYKFRIHLGPLCLARYESFLPGGSASAELLAWVRQYICFDFAWDARLVLARDVVPQTRLGEHHRLGWTTWVGEHPSEEDADDLDLDLEGLSGAGWRSPPATLSA